MSDLLFEKVCKQEKLFDGIYLHLERLTVELPDKTQAVREIVRVPNAVAIFPVDSDKNVILVRQHRLAIGRTVLEIPAGLIDPGENAEAAVKRECEEETGYVPRELIRLSRYAHAVGYSTGWVTLYLGRDLEYTGNTHLDDSEFLEVEKVPFSNLTEMVRNGEIVDTKTLLGTLMVQEILSKEKEG